MEYPTAFMAVDNFLCLVDKDMKITHFAVAQKPKDVSTGVWRLGGGGFTDPQKLKKTNLDWDEFFSRNDFLEQNAIRECKEEYGIDCLILKNLGSFFIDDERYGEDSEHCIVSSLFLSITMTKELQALDDICNSKWVNLKHYRSVNVARNHSYIFDAGVKAALEYNEKLGK